MHGVGSVLLFHTFEIELMLWTSNKNLWERWWHIGQKDNSGVKRGSNKKGKCNSPIFRPFLGYYVCVRNIQLSYNTTMKLLCKNATLSLLKWFWSLPYQPHIIYPIWTTGEEYDNNTLFSRKFWWYGHFDSVKYNVPSNIGPPLNALHQIPFMPHPYFSSSGYPLFFRCRTSTLGHLEPFHGHPVLPTPESIPLLLYQ
jgi:hypothetical protein